MNNDKFYVLTDDDLDNSDRCETEYAYKELREEYLKVIEILKGKSNEL